MADRSRVRETEAQIAADIERQVKEQVELRAEVDKKAKEVQKAAKSFAPVRTGRYAASIQVEKRPDVDGLPVRRVVAKDFKAHWIEFGTGEPGPTKAFAPMEKAANAAGGTLDGVTSDSSDAADQGEDAE